MLNINKDIRIKDLIKESLEEAYRANFNDNKLKSAKFVECFGTKLFEEFYPLDVQPDDSDDLTKIELKVQRVNEDGNRQAPR